MAMLLLLLSLCHRNELKGLEKASSACFLVLLPVELKCLLVLVVKSAGPDASSQLTPRVAPSAFVLVEA